MGKRGVPGRVIEILIALLLLSVLLNTLMIVRKVESIVEGEEDITGKVAGTVSMAVSVCGNGEAEGAESCDGADLRSQTCVTQGFGGGTLSCLGNCSFNTSACTEEDTTAPVITLISPLNNTNHSQQDIRFTYNTTDASSSIKECSIFLDGTKKKTQTSVNETIHRNFILTSIAAGSHNWQVNCTDNSTNENQGGSTVWNFSISINSSDTDGDGIDDASDSYIGTNASVNTSTLKNPIIYINHSANVLRSITGSVVVNVTDEGNELVSFTFDFDSNTLNLSNLRVDTENSTESNGKVEVVHLTLPSGTTKALTMSNKNTTVTSICAKDSAGGLVENISSDCSASDETFLECDGSSLLGKSCSEVNNRLRITGFVHTAARQQADGPSGGGGGAAPSKGGSAQQKIGQPATPSPAPSVQQPSAPRPSIPSAARPSATPTPSAPKKSKLFDVENTVIQKFKEVLPGEEVVSEVALFYLGDERLEKRIDIFVYYAVLDEQQNMVAEKFETVAIETKTVFIAKLKVPLTAKPGSYWFYSRIVPSTAPDEVAESFDTFTILAERRVEKPLSVIPPAFLWGTLLAIILIVLISGYEFAKLQGVVKGLKEQLDERSIREQLLEEGMTKEALYGSFLKSSEGKVAWHRYINKQSKKGR